jgi:hypothetical protein
MNDKGSAIRRRKLRNGSGTSLRHQIAVQHRVVQGVVAGVENVGFFAAPGIHPGCSVWLDAIAESHRKSEKEAPPVTADSIRQWFAEAERSQVFDRQEVPPRVLVLGSQNSR